MGNWESQDGRTGRMADNRPFFNTLWYTPQYSGSQGLNFTVLSHEIFMNVDSSS